MAQLQSIFGFLVLVGIAWLFSEQKTRINWRTIVAGLALQVIFCVIFVKIPYLKHGFLLLNNIVLWLSAGTQSGTAFVFGYLGGGPTPFELEYPQHAFVLAFQGLPLVLVASALCSVLFYWRVLPIVVKGLSWALENTLSIGGAEALGSAANIFLGMTEAPLFIRPYLKNCSRSEVFTIMTGGMATIGGTVMVLYAGFVAEVIPDAMGHILAASFISAPAAITIAKLMIPHPKEIPLTGAHTMIIQDYQNTMDALSKGTTQGIQLFINIVGMLIVFVALVYLGNNILEAVFPTVGGQPLTLQRMLGVLLATLAWLMGIPWAEASTAGSLLGVKTVLNELLAYLHLGGLPEDALSERSRMIMLYALCGFANFGSLGIMIGALGTLCPQQREVIVKLGLRSIVAGTLATCMTGAVIGMIW